MAIQNRISVYIDGKNRTANVVLPIKFGNFLDERLDECQLSLRGVKIEHFSQLTPVEIHISSVVYWGINNKRIHTTQEKVYQLVVANDNGTEMQIGKGSYNHDLYLIEITKIAECSVVDTITFTNDLGKNYAKNAEEVEIKKGQYWYLVQSIFKGTPNNYVSPLPSGERFTFASYVDVFKSLQTTEGFNLYFNENLFATIKDKTLSYSLLLSSGLYRIDYIVFSAAGELIVASYEFRAVENKFPLKKWTITDVINRTLDLAEPLRKGEKPRFRLNGMDGNSKIIPKGQEGSGQAALFDKILAPQFSFTKQTLRECLQEVGKVVHGEPRLSIQSDSSGYYYEVAYDMYASQEVSGISVVPYIKKDVSATIENYASHLDSNAENLVNQLDKFSGVIVEPYINGAKTVRTENLYVRISDSNMLIATQYPIYTVEKLEYVYNDGDTVKSVDITAWLFEKSVYDSQLSSYSDRKPFSKAYALYYSQGNKNIGGLNFKVDAAVFAAFENYAITNILRNATNTDSGFNTDYPKMCFRVTYTPFYNARIGQTKSYYKDFPCPAALIFNQQANVVESRYYGENLKGAIARIGNMEKSLTYLLYGINQLPQAGNMYDKDYYISAVAIEVLPTVFKCTIGLSKDFNRLSAYIGISSVKRFSEISQNQAVERNTLYREFIVIGTQETPDSDCLVGSNLINMIADTFTQSGNYTPLSNVCAWGTSYQGTDIANGVAVNLPVISSAFGNSISFSWRYEDNYSAGDTSEYVPNAFTSGDIVSGYFQNSQSYTDYYGRLYYYSFDLQVQGPVISSGNLTQIPLDLPRGTKPTASSGYVSTIGQKPYILRKDNREALQVNFQIDFVTNLANMIIGSALASYCPAVRGTDRRYAARLYVFPTELNKFTDHVEGWEDVDLETLPSVPVTVEVDSSGNFFTVDSSTDTFPAAGQSWAIVTTQSKLAPERVEDEQGNETEYKQTIGGDLLIGRNETVSSGQQFKTIYFTKKRNVYDYSVWKDIK